MVWLRWIGKKWFRKAEDAEISQPEECHSYSLAVLVV